MSALLLLFRSSSVVTPPPPPVPVTAPPAEVEPGFSVYAYDLVTKTKLAEVPYSTFTFTETLNRSGSWDLTLPIYEPAAGTGVFEPGATLVVFDDGGLIRFGGICWQTDADFTDQLTFTARGEGRFSYYSDGPQGSRRTIQSRAGMSYTTSDSSAVYQPSGDGPNQNVAGNPDASNLWNDVDDYPPNFLQAVFSAYGTRSVSDGISITGWYVIASSSASFSADDVGGIINGTGLQANTRIVGVPDATHAYINLAATATAGSEAWTITKGTTADPSTWPEYLATFNVPGGNFVGSIIDNVQLEVTMSSSNARVARLRLQKAGVNADGPIAFLLPGGPAPYRASWPLNPFTGLPWTPADIDDFASGTSAGAYIDNERTPASLFGNADWGIWNMRLLITSNLAAFDITFDGVDQFLVTADLIDHATEVAGPADAGYDDVVFHGTSQSVAAQGPLSDVSWTRTYWGYEKKGIGQAITEISQRYGGFDFSDSWEWDYSTTPPTPVSKLHLWYPRRGVGTSGIILELGTNVTMGTHTRDGTGVANPLHGVGAGSADAALRSDQVDTSLLYPQSRLPYIEGTYDAHEEAIQANLDARTRSRLSRTKAPVDTFQVEVIPTQNFRLGDIGVGDALEAVLIPPTGGWSFVGTVRIVQQSVTLVAETGLDKWVLDLALDSVSTGQF
jgi:hypothetical protein